MPSSHTYQLNEIMELVILSNPNKIIDIGPGYGKYGVLIRDRLDLWYNEKNDYDFRKIHIDCIEVFKKYITPIHEFVYNHIFNDNALYVLPKLKEEEYDLALLIDVFEHFSQEDGLILLNELKRISKNVIVSFPKILGNQGETFGNIYETHLTQWNKGTFSTCKDRFFVQNRHSVLCYFGEDAQNIKNKVSFQVEL